MRKKIALLSLVSAFAVALFAVPAANAAYITVSLGYSVSNICRPAPDVVQYKLKFKAKVERSGVPKPEKVRVGYQVLDSNSKKVLRSGVVNLKRKNGYSAKSSRITATAGQTLTYHISGKYTVLGQSKKANFTYSDFIPSVEQMDAAGFPAC